MKIDAKKIMDWSVFVAAVLWCVMMIWWLGCGCYRSIEVTRDGEYALEYTSVGLKTDVSRIEAEKAADGSVRVVVEGVATDVSERNREIIEAGGAAVGAVAEKVVEGACK